MLLAPSGISEKPTDVRCCVPWHPCNAEVSSATRSNVSVRGYSSYLALDRNNHMRFLCRCLLLRRHRLARPSPCCGHVGAGAVGVFERWIENGFGWLQFVSLGHFVCKRWYLASDFDHCLLGAPHYSDRKIKLGWICRMQTCVLPKRAFDLLFVEFKLHLSRSALRY